ncbi:MULTISPECIES: low temperature requirement protein A [Roseobacteraceae]|uniref:low temperature requirement protein A n=1 Tax=Roseobacteraceae TaxID=2854170 RepID=UPI00125F405F|nr:MULTISPECIES: low temperature requirement protein A [Roseobacteraceae]KAB6717556.1 low temperature requirement protein A [Roseobacter sp. TSBP12]|tara:strand:- start:7551 stop:8723 length:1173 start_codon:yes stop_codon:yes gene_type:complete
MSNLFHRLVPTNALRALRPEDTPRVTTMELFFDLVYVFTIIQLSHYLLEHASWLGALEYVTLFAAVWWAWNYTAWAANWVNPDHPSGRGLMIVLMGCALLMAVAAPQAFSDRAGLFAFAYVAMALIRAGYMAFVFRGQVMGRNYTQLGAWSAISGLFWILGAFIAPARLELWILAVLIDYAAPYVGFWLPGKGATPMSSWTLKGLHLFERNQLIFIIALGESILLLGGYLVSHEIHLDTGAAALIGFLLIVTLWWIYFVDLSEPGEHRFEHATDHTSLARAGLAYAHGVAVCGAIVTAVAIEMIVAHPHDAIHAETAIIAFAGPSLFLLGCTIFHRVTAERLRGLYLLAVAALAGWGWLALSLHLNGLWLGAGVLLIMVAMAALSHRKAA